MASETSTRTHSSNTRVTSNFLRIVLRGDAFLCAVTALALLMGAGPISSLMGLTNVLPLYATAVALAVYVAALFYITAQERLNLRAALLGPSVNLACAALSVALLVTDWLPLSLGGKWLIGIMGLAVLDLAVLQIYGLWRAYSPQPRLTTNH